MYFDPAVQSSETKKIDTFFKEKERGILNKLGTTNKEVSSPKRLLSSIGASSENDPPTLQTDLESSPIAPQVLDSLMTILKLSSPSERYQKLLKFIQNEVSPFDAKRIAFHLKYVDNELQKIFLESFPPGQHKTNNIFSLLTKIGNGDQGLYEIQSLIKPRLVVRKRIIETFYKSLSVALKKVDNPGAGPEFEPVFKIINPGNWNKGMTADEVRVCLLIFLKLLKEFRLPKLAKLGHRTMQVFSELIDQGVRMSQNNYLDDFVEVFYKKLITDLEKSPSAEPLDDIQSYYKSLEETIGAISGINYKGNIENKLKEARHKRKDNTSMVHFLINDYRLKNPEGNISINDLARFDPAFDSNLHEEFKKIISNLEGFIDIPNSKSSHRAVVLGLGSYREFLNSQDNELKLFQILKWMGGYLNQGQGSGVYYRDLALELYLETYISIIQYAYKVKNLRTYYIGLPQIDYALFNAHVENSSWGDYKIDYFHRLGFSSKFLDSSRTLTVYMLSLHILARKFKLDLVNNTERELVRELRRDNFKILKERAFKTNPQGVYERLAGSNVHVGDKSGNFEIYYISNPNEVRVLAENKFDVDKADEAKITRTKYVYLLHSEIPYYLFKIGYDYREWNNFLYGKMEGILYENTKGIAVVNELLFKYIGYLPVLVYSGPVTALIEVAVDKATDKAIEVMLPDSHVAQFLAGLALSFSPTPGVKDLSPPKANKILREQELEALSETGARFRGTTNPGTDLNDILTGAKQQAVRGGADIYPRQRANTPLVDTILDKLPNVEHFAAKISTLTEDEWNRLGQALPTKGTPRTIGESAQQHLPSAISRRLGSYAKREINPDYPVLGMARGTGLPPYPKWSSKFIHDYFAKEVLGRKAKEKVFETPWSASRGLGTRKLDDFDKGVGMEFNTQPWSVLGQAKLSKKIDQVGSHFTLMRVNKKVKKIIWVGSEPLPTSGLGAKLAEALREAGIPYWHVPLP